MGTSSALKTIFDILGDVGKCQQKFLCELFSLVFSIQGRLNFTNMSRYSKWNECSLRRHYAKFFDWLRFNIALIGLSGLKLDDGVIGALDCSYISKSGKRTYGLDRFWSGVANRAKQGLEITLLCCIDVLSGEAWTVDATQTPGGLSAKEGQGDDYTRSNVYLEQWLDCLPYLGAICYYVADGFYAKKKFFNTFTAHGKQLITKLRSDANLRYLYQGTHPKGRRGRKKKYDGKVDYQDLSRWTHIGADWTYPHLHIYTQILNSPRFERNLKVVLLHNTRSGKYVLLASTDLKQQPRQIVHFYQLRFQIEFLFRDAKQFAGLTHCQARDEHKLDFHFNFSLAAVNLARLEMKQNQTTRSFNSMTRKAYNKRLITFLFDKLSLNDHFDLNNPSIQQAILLGEIKKR